MKPLPDSFGAPAGGWACAACGGPLQVMKVDVTYMGSSFPVELTGCPVCRSVFIPPDLAMGKMLEVEKILEDK